MGIVWTPLRGISFVMIGNNWKTLGARDTSGDYGRGLICHRAEGNWKETSFACPRLRRGVGNIGKNGTYNSHCVLWFIPRVNLTLFHKLCYYFRPVKLSMLLYGAGEGEGNWGPCSTHILVRYIMIQHKAWHRAHSNYNPIWQHQKNLNPL